jgi:D-beta-D-heptose 7-phosphate kinase/D-beta-D-heptose 1-phosphate adenosyltransferase
MHEFTSRLLQQSYDLTNARLLIVGDVMLDRYWHGSTTRISPEAPVPVVSIDEDEARVGGAGNVALNAAVLGSKSYLLGLAGCDIAADQIEQMLTERGVSCTLQRVVGSKTITKLRILSRHQQLIRLDFEDQFLRWDFDALLEVYNRLLQEVDVVVLSDYAKGTLRRSADLVRAARAIGKKVIIDPKGTDFERYRGATVITPNFHEFEAVVGRCSSDSQIVEKAEELRSQLDLEAVLITRSEKGMTLVAKGFETLHLHTRAHEVYDVTGAGDTVVATLGAAIAAGISLPEAVMLSNYAAGVVVGKLGTATVTFPELLSALKSEGHSSPRRHYDEEELEAVVSAAKAKGERVAMTNGCFDILHPGHIDYLERARALGDRLVVAVNDDASIRRIKGETRPINPLETRVRMLLALSCVDWVVVFSEDTPERLYCRILPDILMKGSDYLEDAVAGGTCVKAAGGQVKIVDLLPGHSTTDLISRINNRGRS